jgi:ketosteroid isomerase-like protein
LQTGGARGAKTAGAPARDDSRPCSLPDAVARIVQEPVQEITESPFPMTTPSAIAQFHAIHQRFIGAFARPAGDFIEALTGEDFLGLGRDGEWAGRAGHVRAMREPRWAQASCGDVQVRLFGPVAVLHSLVEGVTAQGQVQHLRRTDVHARQGDAWRMVGAQETMVADGVSAGMVEGSIPSHAPWGGQDPRGDEHSVLLALNDSYVRAFREADVAWYAAHLAPDYVCITGSGMLLDRAATLARFALPTFATSMRSFPVDKVVVRRFGELALVHAENDYELKDGRRGIDRYTDIWARRQEGGWTCIAAHITTFKAAT